MEDLFTGSLKIRGIDLAVTALSCNTISELVAILQARVDAKAPVAVAVADANAGLNS